MTQDFEYLPYTQQYSTYDLGLASALATNGFELLGLDKASPQKVLFVFRRVESIDQAVNAYWNDTLKVNARMYFDSLKMLKNRIYSD